MKLKWAKYFGIRLAVSFVVAILVVYFLVVEPHRQAIVRIDQHTKRVNNALRAFERGVKRFEIVASPADIQLASGKSAHELSESLRDGLPVFNIDFPINIGPYRLIWKNEKIDNFNRLMNDEQYTSILSQTKDAAQSAHSLMLHHAAVMDSLDNFLDYNPTDDVESANTQEVYDKLESAKNGFEQSIKDIEATPQFADPTLSQVIEQVKKAELARAKYHQAVGEGRADGTERQDYIKTVMDAQKFIIKNRQSFWEKAKAEQLEKVNGAYDALQPYRELLSNL